METTEFNDVTHPKHYTAGKFQAIDVIEDAVQFAPNNILAGQQWQVLKYMLRLWSKGSTLKDAKKARWYLNRLIDELEDETK